MQVFALVIFFTTLLWDETVHSDQADGADIFLSCIIGVKLVCTNYEVVGLGAKHQNVSYITALNKLLTTCSCRAMICINKKIFVTIKKSKQ